MAVAANWVLSEFVPGLVIALVLFFQVRREISRSPAFSTDYQKLAPKEPGGGQDGVFRLPEDAQLITMRPGTAPRSSI